VKRVFSRHTWRRAAEGRKGPLPPVDLSETPGGDCPRASERLYSLIPAERDPGPFAPTWASRYARTDVRIPSTSISRIWLSIPFRQRTGITRAFAFALLDDTVTVKAAKRSILACDRVRPLIGRPDGPEILHGAARCSAATRLIFVSLRQRDRTSGISDVSEIFKKSEKRERKKERKRERDRERERERERQRERERESKFRGRRGWKIRFNEIYFYVIQFCASRESQNSVLPSCRTWKYHACIVKAYQSFLTALTVVTQREPIDISRWPEWNVR